MGLPTPAPGPCYPDWLWRKPTGVGRTKANRHPLRQDILMMGLKRKDRSWHKLGNCDKHFENHGHSLGHKIMEMFLIIIENIISSWNVFTNN